MNPNIRDLCRATLFGPTRATNRCVVPLWQGRVLHGGEDATLLWVTDEPIMAKFGLHAVLEQTTGRTGPSRGNLLIGGGAYAQGLHLR